MSELQPSQGWMPSRRWPLTRLHQLVKASWLLTAGWILVIETVALRWIRDVPWGNLGAGFALNALWLLICGAVMWLGKPGKASGVMSQFSVAMFLMVMAGFAARALFYGWSTAWLYGIELLLLLVLIYLHLIYLWAWPPAWQQHR